MEFSNEVIAGFGGALLGALISGVFAWRMHRSELMDSYRREFLSAVSHLLDIREKIQECNKIQDQQERDYKGGIIHIKRTAHLETAQFLATKLGSRVGPPEYDFLAQELGLYTNFNDAERFHHKAVQSAKDRRSKLSEAIYSRNLGAFYFMVGPLQDYEKGRKWFRSSVQALTGVTDYYSIYTLGLNHETWGFNESTNGFIEAARTQFDSARKYYRSLPDSYPQREQLLNRVDGQFKQLNREMAPLKPSEVENRVPEGSTDKTQE